MMHWWSYSILCLLVLAGPFSMPLLADESAKPDRGAFWRQKVSLSARGLPLNSAIEDIAQQAQVKVEWDLDALKQMSFDVEQPVTLTIEQEPFHDACRKLLRWNQAPGWQNVSERFRRGVLTITSYAADRQQTRQALPEWLRTVYDNRKITASVDDDGRIAGVDRKAEASQDA